MAPKRKLGKVDANALAAALRGRRVLVVGGTAGIGKALAEALLKRGADVTVVGRRTPGPELAQAKFVPCDLALMANAVKLADEVDLAALDIIVFTNGIFAAPQRQVTAENLECDLAVSYLSRLALARRLKAKEFGTRRAQTGTTPRIFVMGYPGVRNSATLGDLNSEKEYGLFAAHMNTVVGNEALVQYLNDELRGTAHAYGLNPGLIRTEIRDNALGKGTWRSWFVEGLIGLFTKSAETYAENVLVHALASPALDAEPGALLDATGAFMPANPFLTEGDNAARLLAESTALIDRALAVSS